MQKSLVSTMLFVMLAGVLSACVHAPKTSVASASHLPAEAYPVLREVCPEVSLGRTSVTCAGAHLSGVGPKGRWAMTVDARDLHVGALFGRYLVVTATVEGTFSYVRTTIIDARDGSVLLDNDGALFHVDPKGQVLLFVPTGSAVGQATVSPTIYRLALKNRNLDIRNYTVRPRPSCGKDENDVTGTPGDHDIYTSGSLLVFPRQDLCGPFDFTVPLP